MKAKSLKHPTDLAIPQVGHGEIDRGFEEVRRLDAERVQYATRAAEIRAAKVPVIAYLERIDFARVGTVPVEVPARAAAEAHESEANRRAERMDALLVAIQRAASDLRKQLREATR